MSSTTKCKNCAAPIEHVTKSGYDLGYWRHVREVHTGRLWCFPKADMEATEFHLAAEAGDDSNV